jgi:hypothetical protein
VYEHDGDEKADGGPEQEPDDSLLGGEEGGIAENVDQQRAVAPGGLEELAEHVVDVRQRPVVDRERPSEPDSLTERLVALPDRPEAGEDGKEGECPAEHAIH